jgi:hypothetical protein
MYRFFVSVGRPDSTGSAEQADLAERYEKPTGRDEQLVSVAARDRRAQILQSFARFPLAHVAGDNCIDQTLVQFRDLRYTEPGPAARGSFALDVPVDCNAP